MEDCFLTDDQVEQLCRNFYISTLKKNHGSNLKHVSDVVEGFKKGLMVARVIYESKGNQNGDA